MKRLLCLLPLMACGDDGGTIADAPTGDDGQVTFDAPTDAPSGAVTLTIRDQGAGVAGVDVYFQNPDGSLVAKVPTNASGVASAMVASGGTVTAVDPFANPPTGAPSHELKTYLGVKPGDQLLMEGGDLGTSATVTVTIPTITNFAYAEFSTTCEGDFLTAVTGEQVTLFDCGGTADVVVVAFDENDNPLGFFFKTNVAITDGGTVNLGAETYAAVPDATFAYSNIPAAFSGVDGANILLSARGEVYTTIAGTNLTAGAATATTPRPLATPTTSVLALQFEPAGATMSQHNMLSWQATAATHAVDGTNKFLPSFTAAPTYTPATRQVSWTSTGTVQPEVTTVTISALRDTPAMFWEWEVIAPYTATNVTLPALPSEIAQYVPLAADTVDVDELTTGKLTGGYDAIRAVYFANNDLPPITGASGEILFVEYDVPQVNVRTSQPSSWRDQFAGRAQTRAAKLAKVKAALAAKAATKAKAPRARR